MHGEVLGYWKVHAFAPKLRFSYAIPENPKDQHCACDIFSFKTHLKLFLMGGCLLRLGIHSFLQIVESNSENWNQAIMGESIEFKLTDTTTNQVGSGFSRTAFCQSTSLVAFPGRPYNRTWLGSTRL
jgi:hypothetical protein